MARVFVLQPNEKDISRARTYGEIVYIFGPADFRPNVCDIDFGIAIADKLNAMKYDPLTDFILLVGNFVSICIFVSIVSEQYDSPRALAFDQRGNFYFPIVLGINHAEEPNSTVSHN